MINGTKNISKSRYNTIPVARIDLHRIANKVMFVHLVLSCIVWGFFPVFVQHVHVLLDGKLLDQY